MKLLSLLNALDPLEFKEFEKLLKSPYFTESEQCLTFFKHFRKRQSDSQLDKTALEKAYRRCFGKEGFTESKFYNLTSHLSHLLENYFIVKMVLDGDTTTSWLRRDYLTKAIARRNAVSHFQAETQRLIGEIEAKPAKDVADFSMLHQLYQTVYFHPDISQDDPQSPVFQGVLDNLNLRYFLESLRLLAEMKTRKIIFRDQHQLPMEQMVLAQTAEPGLLEAHPLLHIYHRLVKLYDQTADEAGFRELIALFLEKFDLLPLPEKRYLLKHLVNYGISLQRQRRHVNKEVLALYKKNIEAGSLLLDGRLTLNAYVNIIKAAAGEGELDWAEGFAKQQVGHLEESLQASAYSYAQAWLFYCKGELDAAQDALKNVDFPTLTLDIEQRILFVKIIFDRYLLHNRDHDFLISILKTNEKYLLRQQMAEEKQDSHVHFIRFLRSMATKRASKNGCSDHDREKLREKLKALKVVIAPKWLEERIDRL